MFRSRRRSIVFFSGMAIAALGVSATPAISGTGASSERTAATPGCAASGLAVWLPGPGSGAAGSEYFDLRFTNLSGHACTLLGYPGVSAVDLRDHQVGSSASRNHGGGEAKAVKLANGQSATAILQVADVANYPASKCRPVTAAGLRVYPPEQTASKVVPFPFRACSRRGTNFLSIEVVKKT
jgi:hypothetical protein